MTFAGSVVGPVEIAGAPRDCGMPLGALPASRAPRRAAAASISAGAVGAAVLDASADAVVAVAPDDLTTISRSSLSIMIRMALPFSR
jgi:hypothetical protein